jgi:excisionase family DNA binding protein
MLQTTNTLSLADDVLATTEEAAELIKIKASTLRKWRSTGENNIPFIKIGRSCRYRVTDLKEYVRRQLSWPD